MNEKKAIKILKEYLSWLGDKPNEVRDAIKTLIDLAEFKKPSHQEVVAYLAEIDSLGEISAREFIDHHEANGWRVGKSNTKMKNWKLTVRTWVKRVKLSRGKNVRKESIAERNERIQKELLR